MNAVRGRVHQGHVEIDGELPEGAEVVVLIPGEEEPFELEPSQRTELETRIAEADRGESEPAQNVIDRLRARR